MIIMECSLGNGYIDGIKLPRIKEHEELVQLLPTPTAIIEEALESVTSLHCNRWINDSSYDA